MRKVYYNITVTGLSVVVALLIGTVELLQVASRNLQLTGGAWDWLNALDFQLLGYIVVGAFAATWVVSVAVWKLHHVEDRWSRHLDLDHRKDTIR